MSVEVFLFAGSWVCLMCVCVILGAAAHMGDAMWERAVEARRDREDESVAALDEIPLPTPWSTESRAALREMAA